MPAVHSGYHSSNEPQIMKRTLAFVSFFAAAAAFADGQGDEEDGIRAQSAEISIQIEAEHEFSTNACEARLDVEYYQKGDSVHVNTTLFNESCAASSGTYALEVRYRGGDDEVRAVEFEEEWQRSDSEPVALSKDYYLAANIDVMRVRSRRLRCECASAPEETGADDGS